METNGILLRAAEIPYQNTGIIKFEYLLTFRKISCNAQFKKKSVFLIKLVCFPISVDKCAKECSEKRAVSDTNDQLVVTWSVVDWAMKRLGVIQKTEISRGRSIAMAGSAVTIVHRL